MINLTEDWKSGRLTLDKSYYLRLKDGSERIQMYVGGFLCNENNPVVDVLAAVPSFEQWETAYECLVSETNEKKLLKELLKECRKNIECTGYNEFGKPVLFIEKVMLLNKIDEALGDKTDE